MCKIANFYSVDVFSFDCLLLVKSLKGQYPMIFDLLLHTTFSLIPLTICKFVGI